MLCILHHGVAQLILAYSWAKPVTIVAEGVEGNVFTSSVSLFSFIFHLLSIPLFYSSTISSIFLLPFSGRTQNDP